MLKHAKSKENPKRRVAHSRYVNTHNNAIVHAIVSLSVLTMTVPPAPSWRKYLGLLLPLSYLLASHPSYIPSRTVEFAPSTFNTSILLGWPQSILYRALSSILHPFSYRLISTIYLPHFNSSGLAPINSLSCTLTYT